MKTTVKQPILKEFEVYRNGTQEGTLWAKNKKDAENIVFATYGEYREVYEVEYDDEEFN